jgi:predicted anti-sigma-YlaC factor YlaD
MMKIDEKHNCGFTERDLLLHHYGELGKDRSGDLEEHLPACSDCRRSLDRIARTLAVLTPARLDIPDIEINRFARRVTAQIERRRYGRMGIWGGALAATAAVVLTFGILPRELPDRTRQEPVQLTAEISILEHLEFLQDMDLLEDLDLLLELGPHG